MFKDISISKRSVAALCIGLLSSFALPLFGCSGAATGVEADETQGAAITTGGFAESCKAYWVAGTTLGAECKKGGVYPTPKNLVQIDLNGCIGNNNGFLEWKKDGKFGGSCGNCTNKTPNGPAKLVCDCRLPDGTTRATDFGLDNGIGNADGNLVCGF